MFILSSNSNNVKKTIFLLLAILSSSISVAQSKRLADRYFKEFSYKKSAEIYEVLYKKGERSKDIISKLADSYYNNAETKQAEKWYAKLEKTGKKMSAKHLFRYAQSLRSNGNYKKSDSILLSLKSLKSIQSQKETIRSQDYLTDYKATSNKKISVRNLSTNTEYSDFGGFLHANNIYFASSRPSQFSKEKYSWNNQPFLNIYKAKEKIKSLPENKLDTVLELQSTKILGVPVNTKYHEATPVITKDGQTMYFNRLNFDGKKLRTDAKKVAHLKLYKAKLIAGKWGEIEELPFNDNSYSVGHPALSPDEKTLYFVSDMPGGFGGTDLYKVSINNGKYGRPINLGRKINTQGNERFPFIGDDNTLYFSSDGHLGLGLLDIFQSKITENGFSNPKNLEYPFNSDKDDFAFFIDKEGKKGFFSSNRAGGKGDDDIYSFYMVTIPEVKEVICMQNIKGTVINTRDNNPVENAIVNLIDEKGLLVKKVITDANGTYNFDKILCDKKFTIQGVKEDYKPNTKEISTSNINEKTIKADLNITSLIVGDQIVINPIFFDYGKSIIREDASYELEDIVTVMKNNPKMVIKIEAHTDSRGSKRYNRMLSDRRAKATRDYIISRGISYDRIESAIGYGEDRLLNHCDDANRHKCTEEQHQENRRSYFYIVSGGESVKTKNPEKKKSKRNRIVKERSLDTFKKKSIFEKEKCKKEKKCKKSN